MNARILSRLTRLEMHPGLRPPLAFRIGLLKRLPEEYVGERHVGERVVDQVHAFEQGGGLAKADRSVSAEREMIFFAASHGVLSSDQRGVALLR